MELLLADLSRKNMIESFLQLMSHEFPIPLNEKVLISDYVEKILNRGYILVAEENGEIAGINMFYANDDVKKQAWISLICVSEKYRRAGVATSLLKMSEDISLNNGMKYLLLHVHKDNVKAIKAYEKYGFIRNDSVGANEVYNVTYEKKISRD